MLLYWCWPPLQMCPIHPEEEYVCMIVFFSRNCKIFCCPRAIDEALSISMLFVSNQMSQVGIQWQVVFGTTYPLPPRYIGVEVDFGSNESGC